jgi:hypothetical protein
MMWISLKHLHLAQTFTQNSTVPLAARSFVTSFWTGQYSGTKMHLITVAT